MFRPLFRCRLCWRITFTVFALIFAVESVLLIPSAQRFLRTERQRLADHAQIMIDPLLMRAAAQHTAPELSPVIGHYGLRAVAVFGAQGDLLFHAGEAAPQFAAAARTSMAAPLDVPQPGNALFASWRNDFFDGASVVAKIDASGLQSELTAHLLRIAGLVAIIVLVVTAGTMLVLDIWVLRPMLMLRASSRKAGADPEGAAALSGDARAHGELGELIAAHNAMLGEITEGRRRERQLAEERARFLTHHDAMTGLPNRTALLEHLERRRDAGTGATLFVLNVQRFRVLNATYGTAAGDRLLAELAQRIFAVAEAADFVARLGNDRFALARGTRMAAGDAAALAERLLAAAGAPVRLEPDNVVSPALRVGIAKDCGIAGQDLITQAELALGRSNDQGIPRYEFFSEELAKQARERQTLARDLELAIERGELYIVLQPKVVLGARETRELSGAELLVRWRHPQRGTVSPADFIPLAESTGLIVPLGEFVLREACAQVRGWLDRYGTSPRLAVNLSAQQFALPDLAERIERALEEFDVPQGFLEFEVTESSAMADVARTAAVLSRFRGLGVRVSIDDFGTGYSSLAYLRRFTVDAIKIDKSFVDDIGNDRHGEMICDAILRLGQSLGTKVIAEGVEREDQAAFLRRRRCDEAQGYLFGKPVSPADFETAWLAERAAA